MCNPHVQPPQNLQPAGTRKDGMQPLYDTAFFSLQPANFGLWGSPWVARGRETPSVRGCKNQKVVFCGIRQNRRFHEVVEVQKPRFPNFSKVFIFWRRGCTYGAVDQGIVHCSRYPKLVALGQKRQFDEVVYPSNNCHTNTKKGLSNQPMSFASTSNFRLLYRITSR